MNFEQLMTDLLLRPSRVPSDDLRKARDAFVRRTGRITEAELAAFTAAVVVLLPKVSLIERMAFARQVAPNRNMPHSLLTIIMDDNYLVSAPVLESAPLLSEQDLTQVIQRHGPPVCLAIAKRENLSIQVTDLLMAYAEDKVRHALAGNQTARLSRRSLTELCGLAEVNDTVRDALARRRDLPMTLAARLRAIGAPAQPKDAHVATPVQPSISSGAGVGRGGVVLSQELLNAHQRPRRRDVKTIRYS